MPYVSRDSKGIIVAVSTEMTEAATERVEANAPALRQFIASVVDEREGGEGDPVQVLDGTDLGLVRVLEDLIDLLVDRAVIRFTDLPEPAQKKLTERRSKRALINQLHILNGDQDLI